MNHDTEGFTTTGPTDIEWLREVRAIENENKRLREENAQLRSVMDNETDAEGLPTAGALYVHALKTIVDHRSQLSEARAEVERLTRETQIRLKQVVDGHGKLERTERALDAYSKENDRLRAALQNLRAEMAEFPPWEEPMHCWLVDIDRALNPERSESNE